MKQSCLGIENGTLALKMLLCSVSKDSVAWISCCRSSSVLHLGIENGTLALRMLLCLVSKDFLLQIFRCFDALFHFLL